MWFKTFLLSSALAFGSLALPASADDGVRIVVRHGGNHADTRRGYWSGSQHYDRSYAAHRYRHYVRPYVGYLWTHHRYLSPYARGHAIAHGRGRGRQHANGGGRAHDSRRGYRDRARRDHDGGQDHRGVGTRRAIHGD